MAENTIEVTNPVKAAALMARDHRALDVSGEFDTFRVLFVDTPQLHADSEAFEDRTLEANTSKFGQYKSRLLDMANGKRPSRLDGVLRSRAA